MTPHVHIRSLPLLLLIAACAQAIDPPTPAQKKKAVALLAEECEKDSPGIVAIIAHEGEPWLEVVRGLADIESGRPLTTATTFDLASVSKAFTALAILRLEADGKLSLDTPAGDLVEALQAKKFRKVKIDHMVHMASGLPDYTGDVEDFAEATRAEVLPVIAAYDLEFKPGSAHDYSNTNYFLLALVAEKVSGEPLADWLEKRVFDPLGMKDSSLLTGPGALDPRRAVPYREGDDGWEDCRNDTHLYGDGQVLSSARDMVRWLDSWRSTKLLPADRIARAFAPYTLSDGRESEYAAGWVRAEISERDTVSHGGSWDGTATHVIHVLDAPLDVVVLSNRDDLDAESLAESLLEIGLDSLDE